MLANFVVVDLAFLRTMDKGEMFKIFIQRHASDDLVFLSFFFIVIVFLSILLLFTSRA